MRTRSRLPLVCSALLAAAFSSVSADAALAGRTASQHPAQSWRKKAAGQKKSLLPARKIRRLQSSLRRSRRPLVVATGASAHHPSLGLAGPLGPYGPLGRLGPVVDTAWSASRWTRRAGEWSRLSAVLTELGGPLGEGGPLGPGGPQGDAHDRFPSIFLPGGRLSALGPDGPLGALGPLGPLGPMGAHGFARDGRGRYLEDGRVQRRVTVPYRGGSRTYPLFEVYDADFAEEMTDNDTSFMAVGNLRQGKTSYSFPFPAKGGQHVQMVLTQHAQLDRMRLEILDEAGEVIASSAESSQVNRVELWVPARTRLVARVSLIASGHLLPDKPFSLAVLGQKP